MSRDVALYIDDMLDAAQAVVEFSRGATLETFFRDRKSRDATLRNLEVLGEAAKKVPPELRARASHIPWRRIAGLRDLLAHDYFGLDEGILWDVISTAVPALLPDLQELRCQLNEGRETP